ncbi:MAG: hypothetical protein K0R11_1666, partial [Acidimicrobiales bacterium]|nr:hypothetical protein [Acidimicrobiales bacterium]
ADVGAFCDALPAVVARLRALAEAPAPASPS